MFEAIKTSSMVTSADATNLFYAIVVVAVFTQSGERHSSNIQLLGSLE